MPKWRSLRSHSREHATKSPNPLAREDPTLITSRPDMSPTIAGRTADAGVSRSELKAIARRLADHCATYKGASTRSAIWQLVTTTLAFVVCIAAMLKSLDISYLLTLVLAVPTAGLLVRFFIIQHDCGHGSFLPSRSANDNLGRVLSLLSLTPYGLWKREHAQHHAGAGNLERRGIGDITTLTVEEYRAKTAFERLKYRIYRNPFFLFGFGLPFYFLIIQRLPWVHPYPARETWASVMRLNAGLVVFYGALMWLFGWTSIVAIALPILILASAIGSCSVSSRRSNRVNTWARLAIEPRSLR